MSDKTGINYLDSTWNPIVMRCTPASTGCANCWHLRMAHRHAHNPTMSAEAREAYAGGPPYIDTTKLRQPLRWRKGRRIGVQFMGDLFHPDVPDEFRDQTFAIAALCPQHEFFVLTKRPERMAEYIAAHPANRWYRAACEINRGFDRDGWAIDMTSTLPNVWLGTSCENQAAADERIPQLLRCPAAHRWLSVEPLLGPVDLEGVTFTVSPGYFGDAFRPIHRPGTPEEIAKLPAYPGIDWVVIGGESGPKARPCELDWIRSIVRQCADAQVSCWVKQLGSKPVSDEGPLRCSQCGTVVWSMQHRDVAGADEGNTFCTFCHHEEQPLRTLSDRAGADMAEWPDDLRVRQIPK